MDTGTRRLGWLLALGLILAACGGGDDSDAGTSDNAAASAPETTTSPDAPAETQAAASGSDGSYALITIGDTPYEFQMDEATGQCNVLDSIMGASWAIDADGSPIQAGSGDGAAQVNFIMPAADWEAQGLQPPQISLDDLQTGVRWQAGGLDTSTGVDPSQSEIVSWTFDGTRAEGTATFFDLNTHFAGGEAESVSGTFEFVCAG